LITVIIKKSLKWVIIYNNDDDDDDLVYIVLNAQRISADDFYTKAIKRKI
jgi:hypothetical protein